MIAWLKEGTIIAGFVYLYGSFLLFKHKRGEPIQSTAYNVAIGASLIMVGASM